MKHYLLIWNVKGEFQAEIPCESVEECEYIGAAVVNAPRVISVYRTYTISDDSYIADSVFNSLLDN